MRPFTFGLSFLMLLFLSCSSNNHSYNNPNLLDTNVHFNIKLNLPQFNQLRYLNNPVYVPGYGNKGVIIVKAGPENYVAFDAADPNHPVEDCSALEIKGLEGVSQCDNHNTYNLITGSPIEKKSGDEDLEFSMKPYQVIDNGNQTLTVSN